MRPFDYERPAEPDAAVAAVAARPDAVFLGGGTNLVDLMKLGVADPGLLVDVTGLPLDRIERLPAGLRIGATVRNADAAADPDVRRRYPVLARALLAGASGQVRNMATVGGNLLQRTRCSYFQDTTLPCNKREPGSGCSALHGHTRHHAILGASRGCVAVHPSDMAVALAALDATVRVRGPGGERAVPVAGLYRPPDDAPDRDTVLEHGELVTAVDLPAPPPGRSAYRKVRDRASYAFALVSVAAVLDVADGAVRAARIAFGGLAHRPWRALRAEASLVGAPADERSFRAAADEELALARPLPGTQFKVPMARGALVAALRELSAPDAP
ncbi:FAD binding domain-containing protein [Actinomadura chibensis]|uniref:Xanthine dehydrogenase family protein subunit M n=1 Tax=Actinomadura chibensis TaxID=392828 RepID=A0A5D0NDM3_9ACTN|nr:xanthine dehydrogenase family protein subunit M [Actinomadura chibensis]TYB42462.1 xanthine dehydrogenase family protein subunit M [Actinomadura chibensis]